MLATVQDNRWLKEKLGDVVVDYLEIEATHGSFLAGRDMSFFDRVIELTLFYNIRN